MDRSPTRCVGRVSSTAATSIGSVDRPRRHGDRLRRPPTCGSTARSRVKVMHDAAGRRRRVRRAGSCARRAPPARLTHPNVVAVYDQGDDAAAPLFLVMEFVAGPHPARRDPRGGAAAAGRALAVIEPVLSALAAAHEPASCTATSSPRTCCIADDGRVKVADFGLARAISSDDASTPRPAASSSAPSPTSPPELVVDGRADARADVYAAGVVLYEMLTGAQAARRRRPRSGRLQARPPRRAGPVGRAPGHPGTSTRSSPAPPPRPAVARWTPARSSPSWSTCAPTSASRPCRCPPAGAPRAGHAAADQPAARHRPPAPPQRPARPRHRGARRPHRRGAPACCPAWAPARPPAWRRRAPGAPGRRVRARPAPPDAAGGGGRAAAGGHRRAVAWWLGVRAGGRRCRCSAGKPEDTAIGLLQEAGLDPACCVREFSETVPSGVVISANPGTGDAVRGTDVR